jgi:DNA-binding beta-propeller fold protein YncE
MNDTRIRLWVVLAALMAVAAPWTMLAAPAPRYLSPTALAASPDGRTLYVACATANEVAFFDTAARKITRTLALPASPLGLVLAPDGRTLYVTCAAPESSVCEVDTAEGKLLEKFPAGHTAMAPVLSPDGRTLYVCNRFNNEVAFIDLASGRTTKHLSVPREPVAAAVTPDGKFLLVANHLHAGRADVDYVAASVSVIDTALGKVCKEIVLPNGSGLLRDVKISPDGRHAVVTHQLSRFHLPTTQVERGWVNTSAASFIDFGGLCLVNTVLLDNIDSGAANPWAAAWSADGRTIVITHAGTHELSVVDFPVLLARLQKLVATDAKQKTDYTAASRTAADVPNDLSFLVGLRQRIKLSEADRGPRAVALVGTRAWLANYFTDTLTVIDLAAPHPTPETLPLGSHQEMTSVRRGELLFNDASICFQGWQSCSSCHSQDARVDGLNWDNLNDGIGNPKNAKSLLFAHRTPPSMWLGVRSNAYVAVRAGIRNSLFTVQPEECAAALDEYLKSLQSAPSPLLVKGKLSPAAQRGKKLFFSDAVGCADCHQGPLYTDQKFHSVGTIGKFDSATNRFDTPSLIEVWRTAPYLHDGRAATVRDVMTACNPDNRHGTTLNLTPAQIDDLAAFVLSL